VSESFPFAAALIDWHARAGRHDLPWQQHRTPYRVWVSEIMLQQTQVASVIPYYQRFLARFPDVHALAAAPIDEVLHLWSGLGYYARARNLQRAAQRICREHGGEFPPSFEQLADLPGIGRSTAGAILALSRGERWPILDGNARRVLARYFAIGGPRGARDTESRLWQVATACTPSRQVAAYTQAIMDLGATVCVQRQPQCDVCPLSPGCAARSQGRQHALPAPRTARRRTQRHVYMLVALAARGGVLLERRPEHGVWGGLWCLPEFASAAAAAQFIHAQLPAPSGTEALPPIEHAFTHFDLTIDPLLVRCAAPAQIRGEALWYNVQEPSRVGLPAPIRALLEAVSRSQAPG
jgi:A/G-specific adenine glycosylase